MKITSIPLIIASLILVFPGSEESESQMPKCATVMKCIKEANGGTYPICRLTALEVLWNRDYSIVYYSKGLKEEHNLTCITTVFGLLGAEDTYHHGCSSSELIDFQTSFNFIDKTFTIKNYQNMTLKAYPVYHKNDCLGLFVCNPDGVYGHHITLYCPTKKLSEVSAEIEEAKTKFSACGINDGTAMCNETCS